MSADNPDVIPIYKDGEVVGRFNKQTRQRLELDGSIVWTLPPYPGWSETALQLSIEQGGKK